MTTAAARSKLQGIAKAVLPAIESRVGSKMLAYTVFGRTIGRSATWVRRLVGGEEVGVAHETYARMLEAYIAHCVRVQNEGDQAGRLAAALKAQRDATEARIPHATDEAPR